VFHVSGGSFVGNSALGAGGGIQAQNSNGAIEGATITNNTAGGAGGGVNNALGTVTLQIAKVFANSAPTDPDVEGTFTFV
jgi:hypothetical protein